MCSIHGIVYTSTKGEIGIPFRTLLERGKSRGRDAVGSAYFPRRPGAEPKLTKLTCGDWSPSDPQHPADLKWILGCNRATPTTEYHSNTMEEELQPVRVGDWTIVHNGTIANDKQLTEELGLSKHSRIDSAVIASLLNKFKPKTMHEAERILSHNLVGSYAIAVTNIHLDEVLLMCNYKPISVAADPLRDTYMFTSLEEGFGFGDVYFNTTSWSTMELPAYHAGIISSSGFEVFGLSNINPLSELNKCLVVCSGGLDSTVVAAHAVEKGYDVTLLHFKYDCNAQLKEIEAVEEIAAVLNVPVKYVETDIFSKVIQNSPILDKNSKIASGESGAEFAHEWVPARNLIMLSIAVGIAEAHGFGTIMLGNNLEEAGAYPDNEMMFIQKLNSVIPYAVQVGKNVKIEMPVGNLMKHEIVALGNEIDAPLDLTWSCYHAGDIHCGECGPCYMRKKAFEINSLKDPMEYQN